MVKIHGNRKRKLGLSRRAKHYSYFHPIERKNRPKTFSTQETADSWAASNGIKPGQYNLIKVKKGKRFQVISHGKDKSSTSKKSQA